ncbi:MAG TPA: PLP-dependent lyase/thiolase [Dermatophilaceae bacterium]|nr:PLP-dependent lyase/thiolase [Dermatophilaceae bacterium]
MTGSATQQYARGRVTGYRCATCGTAVGIETVHPFRCPAAPVGDVHHVLHPVVTGPDPEPLEGRNPFVMFGPSLAWWAFARANGMSEQRCLELTEEVAGDFRMTPIGPHLQLSDELDAEVWVKDETGNVGGSHKARHLVGILLHLRAAEELGLTDRDARPPLAIASCGNAAIAAATLAQRAGWPLEVYVPDTVSDTVARTLSDLGARLTRCGREPGAPAGDPAVFAFREAVSRGAIPFSVQGPENGLCLDGGRTIGWEMRRVLPVPTRVLVQVGGGALAACLGWGLGPEYRIDMVQTEGGAPLARAWERAGELPTGELGGRWSELMTPWADPHSLADGILDDETYDWQADIEVMRACGGQPVVVSEPNVEAAYAMATRLGATVSPTGAAGLAALLPTADGPAVQPWERVAILFSGVRR